MKLRYLLPMFLAAALAVSAAMVWLAIELRRALDEVAEVQDRRLESILLADELRQSSDDLTRLARMFVQTGDERYTEYFRQVLAIRNGEAPRPDGYEGIYWDRVLAESDSLMETTSGEAISLHDRMVRLGFTETEFALLSEAQGFSDGLTTLENRAFNAMRGLYDDGTGAFTRVGPPDRALAQGILHGDDYLQAKAAIMAPIGQFLEHVNSRTESALSAVRDDAKGLLLGTFVAAGSLLGLLLLLSVLIHRRVLLRSGALAEAAERITAGDLNVRSGVRGKDELGVLGGTFDKMVTRLSETLALVTAANARMEEELKVAGDIQMSMIPLTFPAFEDRDEISVYAGLEPAREVGGDFYDYYFVDADHLCCMVGDVSGKGAGAALFMAVSKTLIKSKAMMGMSASEIMTQVNDELSEHNDQSMFVTVFLAILNVRNGTFRYCNAGHNPSYVLGANGSTERLDQRHGAVIGAVAGLTYAENNLTLLPGDKVYMYTDGVTEALNEAVELYTEERMVAFLESERSSDVKRLVEASFEELKAYMGEADPADDITVVALEYIGG